MRRTVGTLAALGVVGLAAASGTSAAPLRATASRGGTVTFAQGPGSPPTYIFPLYNGANSQNANITDLQPLMWRPLYWFGHPNSTAPTVDEGLSLADPPVWSNGGRTATIRLKAYRWSDGAPVTSRDVEFWMNLLLANKTDWVTYTPGDWLDFIQRLSYPSPTTFQITFSHAASHVWLLGNALSEITPIPQHAWDRTSAHGPIGNDDRTTKGAQAVFAFLNAQSKSLSTWDTNPLWQVVDGPFRLEPNHGFDPANGYTILVPNLNYSGPVKPRISQLQEVPFTNETAEFDALIAGRLDYGYLPTTDLTLRSRLEHMGYRITPWLDWGLSFIMYNFPNRPIGAVLRQLYVRQALQRLVDQPEIIRRIFGGYATPTYGPVPVEPPNPYISPRLNRNPLPYDPAVARTLLSAHGWRVVPNGQTTCARPGTGVGECGAGIAKGTALQLTLDYAAGVIEYAQEGQLLQTTFSRVGVRLTLKSSPFGFVLSQSYSCNARTGADCTYPLLYWGSPGWTYVPVYTPTGGTFTADTGTGYSGGPALPFRTQLVRLIDATHSTSAPSAMYAYQDYMAAQAAYLWLPNAAYQISVISRRLHGVTAQDSTGHIYPEDWSLSG